MDRPSYDQQLVVVLSSAIRSSPMDAVIAILSAESFAREVNQLGPLGSSALHLAAWRNHRYVFGSSLGASARPGSLTRALRSASNDNLIDSDILQAVISAHNVDVNGQDEESGWTALHRALYFGHVRLASMLMAAGADGEVQDHRGRRPVDLISSVLARNDPVVRASHGEEHNLPEENGRESSGAHAGEVDTQHTASESSVIPHGHVFSWGNGSNYTLGTGSLEVELAPSRVDTLHMHDVLQVGAAKFHSAAVTADGKLFTWGWGRGGRLGHPEKNIHAGSSAVIHPRLVRSLFAGGKVVRKVAVAKHHTLLTTSDGELFSMGGNRHGQLGHGRETAAAKSVAEPKKVTALRACFVVDVAAANKHSVAVTSAGEVHTWGSNTCGQLGYGAFDSTSSPLPRVVDAMKGKFVVMCAAAKRHTVVLTKDGDVLTWGHKGVSPRKVNFSSVRNSASLNGTPLRFQKGYKDVSKPQIERICAGAAHTSALTTTGVVLTWRSADPHCQVQELVGSLAGERVVDISAGKYRTAAVTEIGTVFMWEGRADYNPADCSLIGGSSKKWRSTCDADRGDTIQTHAGRGVHVLGSSIDSLSSLDGSHMGSSPGSLSHTRFGSPSMLERMHSRFKSTGMAAHSPSPSGGSLHSFKGGLGAAGTPQQRHCPQAFDPIFPAFVDRLRRITQVAVGEKHSLALQSWVRSSDDYFSAEVVGDEDGVEACAYTLGPPSLQVQCEETIAKHMVDPYTVLQVMMYAEAAGADMLYRRCCCVAALNLDIVVTEHPQLFAEMPPDLLRDIEAELERIMGRGHVACRSSSKGNDDCVFLTPTCDSNLRMRRPSRADRSLGDAGPDTCMASSASPTTGQSFRSLYRTAEAPRSGSSPCWPDVSPNSDGADLSEERLKLERLILKKLEQVHVLEEKARMGAMLDFQQAAKLGQKGVIMSALAALEGGVPYEEVNALLRAASQAVVESQQRIQSAVRSDGNPDGREREPRDTGRKPVLCSSSKPKAKSRRRGKTQGGPGLQPAHTSPPSSTNPSQHAADVVTASLRQMRIADVPSRSGNPSVTPGSPSVVGFTLQASDPAPVAAATVAAGYSQHASSPIKTVGFRPSMAGRSDKSSKVAELASGGPASSSSTTPAKHATNPSAIPKASNSKQQARKGGLTMFLRGDLDNESSTPNRPAWGGPTKLETPVSPLSKWFGDNGRTSKAAHPDRDVARDGSPSSSTKQTPGRMHSSGGPKPKKVSLAAFMGKAETAPTTAWASKKASPSPSKPIKSLRTIQDEQEELRAATRRITFAKSPSAYARVLGSDAALPSSFLAHSGGHSPLAAGVEFSGTSPHGGKLFVASSGPSTSRWYISEEQSMQAAKAKSLMDIQEEERAAKEMADITRAIADVEQAAARRAPRKEKKSKSQRA